MRLQLSAFSRVALAVGAVTLLPVHTASAIPAFARKYQTSCQTCHIAFPKLNPFGQAFRLLGYRMPGETEDLIKEIPVPLGVPAYKRVWPDAVWPSDIPGTVPLSLSTSFSDVTERITSDDASETIKNDFLFPEEVALLSGGTLGETLSFFGELTFVPTVEDGSSGVEVEIEHSQFNFNGPFGSAPRFNLKVGRFMPEAAQGFGHASLLISEGPAVFFMFQPIASHGGAVVGGEEAAGIPLPHGVDGLEAYGVLWHRLLYAGGLANGIGPGRESADGNAAKDYFGRAQYKFGGVPLDGEGYVPPDRNWRERSLQLGVFAYHGDGGGILFTDSESTDRLLEDGTFTRVGVDANLFYQDANVIAGYLRGRDTLAAFSADQALLEAPGDFTYSTWFAEGDYVLMPWLHGAFRYEWLRPARDGAPDFERIVPNLTVLVRANVKATLQYVRDFGTNDNYLLVGGLRFAF